MQWKSNLEKKTAARFVSKRCWSKKDGSCGKVFNCNRSGVYRPKLKDTKRKRKIKEKGTRKIGQLCPARLFMTENPDGSVEVAAYLTHYGHECVFDHISLSKAQQALLKGKYVLNYIYKRILVTCYENPGNWD